MIYTDGVLEIPLPVKIARAGIGLGASMCDNQIRVKGHLQMARNILVTEIGRDHSNDSMRYLVEITGHEQRTFEVTVPLSTLVKPDREEEIKKLFAHGLLPKNGDIVAPGDLGW